MNESEKELLVRWRTNCNRSQIANYSAGGRSSLRNYWLGIPAVILSAVVGTTVFASLGDKAEAWAQITVGLISVLASVLAALQTFLRYGELAQKFKSTAAEYGAIKRQIDQLLAASSSVNSETINIIREQMDTLAKEGPELPLRIWEYAMNERPTLADRGEA